MGDVAMTVPVVGSIRDAHPGLKITVLTKPLFRPFFREIPGLEFIDYDVRSRHGNAVAFFRTLRNIRRSGAKAAADLQCSFTTRLMRIFLLFDGIRFSVADKGKKERKELTRRSRKVFAPLTPAAERYAGAVRRLGIEFSVKEPSPRKGPRPMPGGLWVGSKKGSWVGIAPFAKHKGKIYPIPLTDKLVEILKLRYTKVFIFGGGAHERSFAEGMEQRHQGVVSVIGRLGLSDEMDVMSNLDAIVTMDSATMQIAALTGVPVVSVWGATHPYLGFCGWGQEESNTVQLPLPCRPCSVYGKKPCIFGDYRCLADIAPEQIAEAVERCIKGGEVAAETPRRRKPRAGDELRAATSRKRPKM